MSSRWAVLGRYEDVRSRSAAPASTARLFVRYAAIGLAPVVALGGALAATYTSEARARGLAEGRSEARLLATTAIEPLLDGRPLSEGLSPTDTERLQRLASRVLPGGEVLRLRIRDLAGNVV